MQEKIEKYARLGMVHHMLYPACMTDPDDHVKTMTEFVKRTDIETFDCCLPYGRERQEKLIAAVRNCGKTDIAFATHLYPARKISFASPLSQDQAQARMIVEDMVRQAAAIGATGFVFPSCGPRPSEATPENYKAFKEFLKWLCDKLAQHHITALLEPFDMTIDKCFLYGPTPECMALIESHKPQVNNLAIELDVAHLPLMGEKFTDAIRTCAPSLARVHIGNCVLRDRNHHRYGDTHPPVGYEAGEIDVPQLVEILSALLEVGFLNTANRGSLLLEMTPWPGKSAEETVADSMSRLRRAWELVSEPVLSGR